LCALTLRLDCYRHGILEGGIQGIGGDYFVAGAARGDPENRMRLFRCQVGAGARPRSLVEFGSEVEARELARLNQTAELAESAEVFEPVDRRRDFSTRMGRGQ